MAYCTTANVAVYSHNLLGGGADFGASTSPTSTEVTTLMSSGCAALESTLAGWGYDMPVAANTIAYDWLKDLNALYAAARAEMSRINVTLGPGERTRGQVFESMFWDGLKKLRGMDLTLAGATRGTSAKLYVGGISEADKDTYVSDSDRTKPRFSRGLFDFSGALKPTESASSDG